MSEQKILIMCGGIVGVLVYSLIYIPFRKKLEKENKEHNEEIARWAENFVQEAFPAPDFKEQLEKYDEQIFKEVCEDLMYSIKEKRES